MNKKVLIIAGIVGLVVITGSFWFLQKNDEQENTNDVISIDTEAQNIKNQQLIAEFENFIKENGEKIELEKLDTTDWQTYTDEKRGFSFEYPDNWHVVEIDLSKLLETRNRANIQDMYRKEQSWGIKSQVQADRFLCVTDKVNYQKIANKECRSWKDASSMNDCYDNYCKFTFKESTPVLIEEKRTSGELWLEHYKKNEVSFLKYVEGDVIIYARSKLFLDTFSPFDFLDMQYNKLYISNYDSQIKGPTFIPIYHTLIQTIKRQ